ncbi:MAG: hypothetical protein KTR32_06895 [Granulosicoccus sp.]|nr:hypothetical protein [Granulosicoccus sp.]
MKEQLRISPIKWLSDAPITIPNPASVIGAFRPGTMKIVKFKGAHRFYRAAGWDSTRGEMASAFGSWWADEIELVKISQKMNMYKNWLPDELLRKALPAQYRGATALCEDWNDMREMYKLDLPPQEEIEGLVGIASAQPKKSTLDVNSRQTPMLPGGAEQVFFKKTPTLSSINPLWIRSERLW